MNINTNVLGYDDYLNEQLTVIKDVSQTQVQVTTRNVIKRLSPILNLDVASFVTLGSAGKLKEDAVSYNINIGVNHSELLKSNSIRTEALPGFLYEELKKIKHAFTVSEDNDVSIEWPINGRKKNGYVDVVLHITENLDWMKFSRYSPNLTESESEYSGKYREAAFKAIAKLIHSKVTAYEDDNFNVKEYEKYIFDEKIGMIRSTFSFAAKHGRLKKAVRVQELDKLVTQDSSSAVELMFGEGVVPEDVLVFENILEFIKSPSFVHHKKRDRILKQLKTECVELRLPIIF